MAQLQRERVTASRRLENQQRASRARHSRKSWIRGHTLARSQSAFYVRLTPSHACRIVHTWRHTWRQALISSCQYAANSLGQTCLHRVLRLPKAEEQLLMVYVCAAGITGGFAGGERGVQQFVEKGELELVPPGKGELLRQP